MNTNPELMMWALYAFSQGLVNVIADLRDEKPEEFLPRIIAGMAWSPTDILEPDEPDEGESLTDPPS